MFSAWSPKRIACLIGAAALGGIAAAAPSMIPVVGVILAKPCLLAAAYLTGVATRTPGHVPAAPPPRPVG